MTTVKEMFVSVIGESIKAAGAIIEQDKKAMAYAEIAKALAMTGLVGADSQLESDVSDKKQQTTTSAKDALKNKPNAKKVETAPAQEPKAEQPKVEQPKAEEPKAPVEPSVELVEVWNEDMQTAKAEEMKFILEQMEAIGNDELEVLIGKYSEGQLSSMTDITPLNVSAFVFYVKQTIKDNDLKFVNECVEAWGADAVETAIVDYSGGELASVSDINTSNASGLAAFIRQKIQESQAA